MPLPPPRRALAPALILCAILALAGCGSQASVATYTFSTSDSATTSVDTTDLAGRPSSPAVIHIVSPASGATIHGSTMHVVIAVDGATITSVVTKSISPTLGHVHLYVD